MKADPVQTFDVLIVGAGLSGIGAAYYVQNARPKLHGTIFDALRQVIPMRAGFSTTEDSMAHIATKPADLVAV